MSAGARIHSPHVHTSSPSSFHMALEVCNIWQYNMGAFFALLSLLRVLMTLYCVRSLTCAYATSTVRSLVIAADGNSSYLYYPLEEEEGIILQAINWKPMVPFYLFFFRGCTFWKRVVYKWKPGFFAGQSWCWHNILSPALRRIELILAVIQGVELKQLICVLFCFSLPARVCVCEWASECVSEWEADWGLTSRPFTLCFISMCHSEGCPSMSHWIIDFYLRIKLLTFLVLMRPLQIWKKKDKCIHCSQMFFLCFFFWIL